MHQHEIYQKLKNHVEAAEKEGKIVSGNELMTLFAASTSTTVYIDTCIVSGLAKGDVLPNEEKALTTLLEAHKKGKIVWMTSDVVKDEIGRIPQEHRPPHSVLYQLMADVPKVSTYRVDSGLTLMGVGGGRREDPVFTSLKQILPDEGDAEHIFQATKNGVSYFMTIDQRTILKHKEQIEKQHNIKVVKPTQLVEIIS